MKPAYGFVQNGPTLLTDAALSHLITSKALPLDEAGKQRRQMYLDTYLQTRWGFIFVSLFMNWLTLGKDEMMKLLKRYALWRVIWSIWHPPKSLGTGAARLSQAEEKQVETSKLLPSLECKLLLTPEEQWVPLERNNLSVTDLLLPP